MRSACDGRKICSDKIVTPRCGLHLHNPVVLNVHVEAPFFIVSARWTRLLRYAVNHNTATTAFTDVIASPFEFVQETILVLPRVPVLELHDGSTR
jgi:hypothetical protein